MNNITKHVGVLVAITVIGFGGYFISKNNDISGQEGSAINGSMIDSLFAKKSSVEPVVKSVATTESVATDGNKAIIESKTIAQTNGSSGNPPTIVQNDLCPNFNGIQSSIPAGFQQDANGNCVCAGGLVGIMDSNAPAGTIPSCVALTHGIPVTKVDICPNISGTQFAVPSGYQIVNGQCVPLPDLCPNIAGTQITVPSGYINLPTVGCIPVITTTISGPTKGTTSTVSTVQPGFYLMAGHDDTQTFNDVWKMNTTTAGWNQVDNVPSTTSLDDAPWSKREYPSSVYFNGKIYLMGGIDATGYLNDIWSYDGNTWTQVDTDSFTPGIQNAPWQARARFSAVVWNNAIWVIGGRINSFSDSLGDVWKSTDGINWTQINPGTSWDWRNGHSGLVLNNKLWIFGGDSGASYLFSSGNWAHLFNDVWNTSDGVTWTNVLANNPLYPASSTTRWNARTLSGSTVYNNKLFTIGGWDGLVLNDMWSSSDGATWDKINSNIWPCIQFPYPNGGQTSVCGRRELTVASFNSKIWMMAGSYDDPFNNCLSNSGECFYNDVWTYDGVNFVKVDSVPSTPGIVDDAPWAARDGLTSVLVP